MTRGNERYNAWIPSEKGLVGNTVDLKMDGEWSLGWTVAEAFDKMPSDYVRERSADYKTQRRASDV